MPNHDQELDRLRAEMDAAQNDITEAQSRLDAVKARRAAVSREIDSVNARIADIRRQIDAEYRAVKACREARDRLGAETHQYNMQSWKDSLQREYEIKKGYFTQLDTFRPEFESAQSALRSAKDRKQKAREAFTARLKTVQVQWDHEQSKWKEKPCKKCGKPVRYHVDWTRVPDLCKDCQQREKAKWHEKPCAKCGKMIRYHEDWEHVPNICKECKAKLPKREHK